jgi:hypothetical protein
MTMNDEFDECPDCEGTGKAGPDQGDRWGFSCGWCDGTGLLPDPLQETR